LKLRTIYCMVVSHSTTALGTNFNMHLLKMSDSIDRGLPPRTKGMYNVGTVF
jgi:hypothetical protein